MRKRSHRRDASDFLNASMSGQVRSKKRIRKGKGCKAAWYDCCILKTNP